MNTSKQDVSPVKDMGINTTAGSLTRAQFEARKQGGKTAPSRKKETPAFCPIVRHDCNIKCALYSGGCGFYTGTTRPGGLCPLTINDYTPHQCGTDCRLYKNGCALVKF